VAQHLCLVRLEGGHGPVRRRGAVAVVVARVDGLPQKHGRRFAEFLFQVAHLRCHLPEQDERDEEREEEREEEGEGERPEEGVTRPRRRPRRRTWVSTLSMCAASAICGPAPITTTWGRSCSTYSGMLRKPYSWSGGCKRSVRPNITWYECCVWISMHARLRYHV